MIDININKISKNYGFDYIFKNISFEIKTGEHIAIVGDNGCGKTTLLNIIAGKENVDSGIISIRNNLKIGYLKQIPDNQDLLVKEFLYNSMQELMIMKSKLERLEQELSSANNLNKIIDKYTKLQEQFINNGGYEIDAKIGKIIDQFNINQDLLNSRFDELSGGEKTIISFASIMLNEPDLLLLDEPTNHLDIMTLEWLEKYLINFQKTIIIVSHDRYFLNKVAKKIIFLSKNKIDIYHGNYDYYIKEKKQRFELEMKEYNNQNKEIERMEKSIKQLREFGKIGDNESFFKRANNIQKRIDRFDKIDKPQVKREIPMNFIIDERSGNDVITIKELNITMSKSILIENINVNIQYLDRICIMGKNGCGKSTLIHEILNNNPNIIIGSNVKIGFIPQQIKFDNEVIMLIDEVRKHYIGDETHLRSSLAKFLFKGNDVFKKLKILSGGERLRLKLFCLLQKNLNALILDEPTNHLDIDTKELLEDALKKYKGTIIFVSHDRYFINAVATHIFYIKDNKLISYLGNYDDFLKHFTTDLKNKKD